MKNDIRSIVAIGAVLLSNPAYSEPIGLPTLQEFVAQLPAINSIALSASVSYLLDPVNPACSGPAGIPIGGLFSYSANGEMWRSHSYLDHEAMSDLHTEVAYDGSMYQYYQANLDVLGIAFGDDERGTGFVLPNPLYAATQFLIPVTDDNSHLVERLSGLQLAAAATDLTNISWTSDAISQQSLEYSVLPGGNHEGHDYMHRVYVITGQHNKPVRIDRVSTTGAVLTRTLLSGYQDFGDGLEFPTSYTMILYNPSTGAESGRIEMTIDDAEINSTATESLDSIDFQIPWNLVGRVWLIDNEVFVN